MKLTRRHFMGLSALTFFPAGCIFAGQGDQSYFFSAASEPDNRHWLKVFRINPENKLTPMFQHALPARGHHVAAFAGSGLYAAVARRPGNWLQFGDYIDGRQLSRVESPAGRHFLGHGVFSSGGDLFYTVENDYQDMTGDSGWISVWRIDYEARKLSVVRQGDFPSYGVGPHELALMPDGKTLVVANGGIRTHPDSERENLNPDSMQPSLVYIDSLTGGLIEKRQMAPEYSQASIRHLDVNPQGTVALVMQYEGLPFEDVPLVAVHQMGNELQYPSIPLFEQQQLKQYCGSVRFDMTGRFFAVSAPRGNRITFWDLEAMEFMAAVRSRDGCGVCAVQEGFLYTAGTGRVTLFNLDNQKPLEIIEDTAAPLFWDNHLTMIQA